MPNDFTYTILADLSRLGAGTDLCSPRGWGFLFKYLAVMATASSGYQTLDPDDRVNAFPVAP